MRTESEKRRFYPLAAESFKSLLNPTERIDEFERLTASDQAMRRLIKASENQTTVNRPAKGATLPYHWNGCSLSRTDLFSSWTRPN
jgi:hypothetical protein